jgi:hypothetical protein
MTQTADSERTLGRLFADATRDLSTLIRDEIELAKSEIRVDVKAAAKGGGMFGAAGFLGVVAFILLSIAAAYALTAVGLHPALAFLIIAVVYLLVAGVLALIGKRQVSRIGPPQRTIETTKESVAVLKGGSGGLR